MTIKKKLRFLSPPPSLGFPEIEASYLDRDGGEREEAKYKDSEDKRVARDGVHNGVLNLNRTAGGTSALGPDVEGVVREVSIEVEDYENDARYRLGDKVHTVTMEGWGMETLDERVLGACGNIKNLGLKGNRIKWIPREVS